MRQTTLNVPLEVRPESASRLAALVDAFRRREDTGMIGDDDNFARIKRDVPMLHFMSISVFAGAEYDPIFVLEANFDGAPEPFWRQLDSAFGDDLRAMLRCCKRPLTADGALYDAATADPPRATAGAYLAARTQRPSVFHHGNRGLSRDRIWAERDLFRAARDELDGIGKDGAQQPGPSPYRGVGAAQVHATLRARMQPAFPWLDQPALARITPAERALDILRLAAFVVAVLFVATLPGIVLAALLPLKAYLCVTLAAGVVGLVGFLRTRDPLPGTDVPTRFKLLRFLARHLVLIAAGIAIYAVAVAVVLILLAHPASLVLAWLGGPPPITFHAAFWPVVRTVLWGLASLPVVVIVLVFWLRWLERRDSSHDAPPQNEQVLREMIRREDWVAQNHMGSIVLIKPGILRTSVISAGHLGLGLLLRVKATDGYLGSMRTVHFAHWAFLNNRSRLLFFSNFDHSWGSYLDDFIEKAHVGLTLAWGCGVGFPPTRFLIYDGASHGRQFKAWALSSRTVSRFWYSAYPKLTVDQVERNNRIANGLRQQTLSAAEAETWMADL